MTAEHFIFIPLIFIFGFMAGTIMTISLTVKSRGKTPAMPQLGVSLSLTTKSSGKRAVSGRRVLSAFALFVTAFTATHLVPLPFTAADVQLLSGGQPLFDQRPSFDSDEVYQRLEIYGDEARQVYQQFTYTTDVLFPLSLLAFLIALSLYAADKAKVSWLIRRLIAGIPVAWFLMDMVENAMTFTLIQQFPRETIMVAGIIGYVTVTKFLLLLVSLMTPIAVLVRTVMAGPDHQTSQ